MSPTEDGLTVGFQRVADAKLGKNRVHLDLVVDDLDQATAEIENLGGRWLEPGTPASSKASGGAAWQTPKATNSTSTPCPPRNTPRSPTQHSPARGSSTAVTVDACNPSTIPLIKAWLSPPTSSRAFGDGR